MKWKGRRWDAIWVVVGGIFVRWVGGYLVGGGKVTLRYSR